MTNISFTDLGQKYFWCGNFGRVLSSTEYVIGGTVRCILGELFYCCDSNKSGYWQPECSDWIPVDYSKQNMEWIREFKKKVVGL